MAISPQLPEGSLVLVTGVNGFIAGHVAKQLLERGYRVRGTVRDVSKSKWVCEELFAKEAAAGYLEIIEVKDMADDKAFYEAVKGVSGIAHVATITSLDADPHNVVPQTVAGLTSILKAAAQEPSIVSFVMTSSVVAAAMPMPETPFHADANSWNDMAVQLSYAPPPYTPERGMLTYMASKVKAEQALWKFVEDEKPTFTVNTVLPVTVLGDLLHEKQNPSTNAWVFDLYRGDPSTTEALKAITYIHVQDVALMHVAALIDPSVQNERIHTWSKHCTWNDILAIFRKLRPNEVFIDDLSGQQKMLSTVEEDIGKKLLKKWADQDGWLDLQTGIKDVLDGKWSEVNIWRKLVQENEK